MLVPLSETSIDSSSFCGASILLDTGLTHHCSSCAYHLDNGVAGWTEVVNKFTNLDIVRSGVICAKSIFAPSIMASECSKKLAIIPVMCVHMRQKMKLKRMNVKSY